MDRLQEMMQSKSSSTWKTALGVGVVLMVLIGIFVIMSPTHTKSAQAEQPTAEEQQAGPSDAAVNGAQSAVAPADAPKPEGNGDSSSR